MKRILISILSDYLQPNFLLIKEFVGRYDQLAFITTKEMEVKEKGSALEKALGLETNSVQCIEVVEDDYSDVIKKLGECMFAKDDEYILNITGGTKVIPIAVCDFFKSYNAQFYYVPIGKNIIRNIYSDETITLKYRLNLNEYFTLNGLRYKTSDDSLYPLSKSREVFQEYKKLKFNRWRYDKISGAQEMPNNEDRRYYSGVWFEDYCYDRLKNELNLPDDSICRGAKIYRDSSEQNDNEIDVMYVCENQLYIFECKLSMFGNNESIKDVVDKYMYKLAAIAKDYGFRPQSYILTLHNVKHSRSISFENIRKRLNILGVSDLLDSSDFMKTTPLLCANSTKKEDCISESSNTKKYVSKNASAETDVFRTEPIKVGFTIVGKIDLDKLKRK